MRITQELLLKYARETVKKRKRSEPDLLAAYLTGSLLSNDPLIGGATDIDIVLVHKYQAPLERETEPLTREISLDIVHKIQDDYEQHRQLRQDPFMGFPLTLNHILLFDTKHWLEFIQSSVSADFHRTDNVLARVNHLLRTARENWFSLEQTPPPNHLEWLHRYLEISALAANAISGLIGSPLTTRRFMIDFSERVETLGVPKIYTGFTGLLGLPEAYEDQLIEWVNAFEQDFTQLMQTTAPPVHLSECRKTYYVDAVRALAKSNEPGQVIWPLLRTWLDIHLATSQPSLGDETWESCLTTLSLTEENASQKAEALDAYLDTIEITIESWADIYGI